MAEFPGIFVEEVPSSPHSIPGVPTSNTGFAGSLTSGPAWTPLAVTSLADFQYTFGTSNDGDLNDQLTLYFENGGTQATVVRVVPPSAVAAGLALTPQVIVTAASPGDWGNRVQVSVLESVAYPESAFDLIAELLDSGGAVTQTEQWSGLTLDLLSPRNAPSLVADSHLIRIAVTEPNPLPPPASRFHLLQGGADGAWADHDETATALIQALGAFLPGTIGILSIPETATLNDPAMQRVWAAAFAFCSAARAFYVLDIPSSAAIPDPAAMVAWFNARMPLLKHDSGAIYYPRLATSAGREVAASGALAGIYARTDSAVGVWKAPAGTNASVVGASPVFTMNDSQNGTLNPLGLNALRIFPASGPVVWGARTLAGNDFDSSEWKYIPVRRLASYIESSLLAGLQWTVFEANSYLLWSAVTSSTQNFMMNLFRQGALQGQTPTSAFFVRCDQTTTSADDILSGRVNLIVGFAPLKPAEFIVLNIRLTAATPSS